MKFSFIYLILSFIGIGVQAQPSTPSQAFWGTGVLSTQVQALQSQLVSGALNGAQTSEINIRQVGETNRVKLTGSGRENRLLVTQNGDTNQVDLDLLGEQNLLNVNQQGSRNVVDLRAVRANGEQLHISQQGNGNGLSGSGYPLATGVPIRIEQSGGMQLLISTIR